MHYACWNPEGLCLCVYISFVFTFERHEGSLHKTSLQTGCVVTSSEKVLKNDTFLRHIGT